MTGESYLMLGYIVGLGLIWGYVVLLWMAGRSVRGQERRSEQASTR